MTFNVGDRVYVTDPALAAMREIMSQATGKAPQPNHHGTVMDVWDNGDTLLIYFDEGGLKAAGSSAPYPVDDVRLLESRP